MSIISDDASYEELVSL